MTSSAEQPPSDPPPIEDDIVDEKIGGAGADATFDDHPPERC